MDQATPEEWTALAMDRFAQYQQLGELRLLTESVALLREAVAAALRAGPADLAGYYSNLGYGLLQAAGCRRRSDRTFRAGSTRN
jgi:hypothetical protein